MKAWMAAFAAALAAGCASNERPQRGVPAPSAVLSGDALLWVSFDSDRDYATSRAEAEAGIAAELERAGGAPLTPIQFEAWSRQAIAAPDMAPFRLEFDRNVDGQITEQEFVDALMARFESQDANRDGRLTRGELVRRMPMRSFERGDIPRRGPEGGGGRRRPPG